MAVYRLNLEEAIAFLYITNKHAEKEIMDTLLFTLFSKYVGVNPDKAEKDLCSENIASLKKEKDTRRWKDIRRWQGHELTELIM